MSKTFKVIIGVLIIILIVAGIVFLVKNKKITSANTFKISVNSWVGYGPMYLAQDKGFFKDEGLDVQITNMEDTAQRKAAMIKGDVNALGDTVDLLVLSRAENVPSVTVLQVDESNGADGILATNNINSVRDLKGKKIAAQKNFVGESFLMYLLKKNSMSVDDVQIIDTESGAAGAAFVSGKVDAAVTFEPWLSKAKERKDGKVLISSADAPGVIVDTVSVNETYLKNNPENVKKFIKAWFKALDYWKNNSDESNQIMSKYYNVTPAEFKDLITGVKWPTYQENQTYFGTKSNPGKIYDIANTFIQVFQEMGSIKDKPDMTKAIDSSLLVNLNK